MHDLRRRLVFTTSLLVISATTTAGGEYSDPAGFSFTYPDGWFTATSVREANKGEPLPPEIEAWIEKSQIDLSKLSVILMHAGSGEFLDNLNVVVTQGQIPVNDSALKDLLKQLPEQLRSTGAKVENLEGRAQKVGIHETLIVEFRTTLSSVPFALKQRQVFIPGGGKTYVVTCTGKADTFADQAQTFDDILASFKVPPPIAQGINWSRALTSGVTMGAIGGVVGGLIAVFRKIIDPKKPASPGGG